MEPEFDFFDIDTETMQAVEKKNKIFQRIVTEFTLSMGKIMSMKERFQK